MVQMDIGIAFPDTSSPPLLVPSPLLEERVVLTQQHAIQSLEKEFQQVRQHIKHLVLKKARLLREMHTHKRRKGDSDADKDHHTINNWEDIVNINNFTKYDDGDKKTAIGLPFFNILPNEVLLHIFSYLSASHLCKCMMQVCALFCSIALDESIWRPLYHQIWGDHRAYAVVHGGSSTECLTWRTMFTLQSRTERNWWRGCSTVSTFEGHKGAVRCVQFTGDTLVTGSADKTIKLWSLKDKQCTQTLHDNKWVRCLRVDESSSTLFTTGMDSTQAKIWSLTTGTVSNVLDVHRGWITCLQLNMPRLITGSLDGTIRTWDTTTGHNQPQSVVHSGHDSLRSLWVSGDLVMSAGLERNLQLWDLRIKTTPGSTKPSVAVEGAVQGNYCVQFDTRSHIVCSGSNGTVALADLRMPKVPPVMLKGHADVISCLQFNGRKLVTGSMDQTIRVWDLTTHLCATTMQGHESWVWDLQFDPDKIVTVSSDKAVKLWAFNHTLI